MTKFNKEAILPIIRKNHPILVKEKLISEQPLPPIEYEEPFKELVIVGGWIHDWLKGYIFTFYRLIKQEVRLPKEDDKTIFYLKIIKELEELDRAESETDFSIVEEKWKKIIKDFKRE